MKAGYAALFGLVVAYSIYQGSGSPQSVQQQAGTPPTLTSGQETQPTKLPPFAEPFPTIARGMCRLDVSANPRNPCGACVALCPAKDLSALIEDYFHGAAGSEQQYMSAHWNVPEAERERIEFIVASLPDPVHTHNALLFDRAVESIQKAAQASGYLFFRAWMPWDIVAHPDSTDFTVRLAQNQLREQIETLPGLMIFQTPPWQHAPQAPILFVFVVGETPTGGVHKEQFQNALTIRRNILGASNGFQGEAKVLRILGPAFSGSLSSLDQILNAQPHDPSSTILIRSGTISSFWAIHGFCESTLKQWPDPQPDPNTTGKAKTSGRPDFVTFQFTDTYQEFYLSRFLKERDHLHSHVAILSEDETAFGNQDQPERSATQQTPGLCQREAPPPEFSFVRLYFPREIARLREAYQRNIKAQASSQAINNPSDNQLPLSLDVTGNDDDSVGTYAPLQTPLSEEAILQSIVAALRKQHVRIVVVRASDPLDTVFLCRYLRQYFPQGRLITVGADLLMIHDLYDPRFHGILATSSYPLLNEAEFPSLDPLYDRKREVHRLFPDSYSVGEFNAFLSLIAQDPVDSSANPKKPIEIPPARYAQFGLPSFLHRGVPLDKSTWQPHLWLETVGRDGYWPVDVLDEWPPDKQGQSKEVQASVPVARVFLQPPERYLVHFTVGWAVFWMLTFALTVLFIFLLWFPKAFTHSEVLGRFGGEPFPARNQLLFWTTALLIASQTLFVFPSIVCLGRFPFFKVLIGLTGVMLLYGSSLVLLGIASKKGLAERGDGRLGQTGAWVCGIFLGVTILLTWWFRWNPAGIRFASFTYRYIDVGSGVSPCLPLLFLFAAWLWWCWQSLTGVVSSQEKHVVLPAPSAFDGRNTLDGYDRARLKGLSRDGVALKSLGVVPTPRQITIPAVAGLGAIFVLMRPSEIAEAVEPFTFKGIYWFLLYSCLFLVCYLVMHIVGLWLEFRALLRSIDRLPFRRGFTDLRSLTWKPLWKLAGNGRQEFLQLLGQELEALNQSKNSKLPSGGLTASIENVKKAANDVSVEYEKLIDGKAASGTQTGVREGFTLLQKDLAQAAAEALIYASEQWKLETFASSTAPTDKPVETTAPVEPPAKEPTTRAVEHFLCLFYLNVILVPLRRLQTLILALAGVFVFVLISYSSYPFESRESFHVLLISIFFVISLVVGVVYGQMYADPLLSRITNTKPGELGLDFWVRLGTFAFVPLLSLLSVQFPSINHFLFSWLQPALQSIK